MKRPWPDLRNEHAPPRRDSSADVAGFSGMMERNEEETLRSIKRLQNSMLMPATKAHGGRLVKTTGDGFLVEFASAAEALRCALEVQGRLHDDEARRDMRLRYIGLNLGVDHRR